MRATWNARVEFGIDATRIKDTILVHEDWRCECGVTNRATFVVCGGGSVTRGCLARQPPRGLNRRAFGVIVFTFPLTQQYVELKDAISTNYRGNVAKNKQLISAFFHSAAEVLAEGGEIRLVLHAQHNPSKGGACLSQYDTWGVGSLAEHAGQPLPPRPAALILLEGLPAGPEAGVGLSLGQRKPASAWGTAECLGTNTFSQAQHRFILYYPRAYGYSMNLCCVIQARFRLRVCVCASVCFFFFV